MSEEQKQPEKMGIEETQEVLKFISNSLRKVSDAKKDDGKIDMVEWARIVMAEAPEAFHALKDANKVLAEVEDLDSDEKEELLNDGMEVVMAALELFGIKV